MRCTGGRGAGGGAAALHHCNCDAPRDGHALLAGAGGGGAEGVDTM